MSNENKNNKENITLNTNSNFKKLKKKNCRVKKKGEKKELNFSKKHSMFVFMCYYVGSSKFLIQMNKNIYFF